MSPPDAYLICATPRSGSTLLCGLLESSGVAGRPASYFNRKTIDDYASSWGIGRPADGRIDAAYVRAARDAGSTPNGVFGGRVMGETRPELLADLAAAEPGTTDRERLTRHLGRLAFVYLARRDVVGQAVSWAKSLQTHFWHPGERIEPGAVKPHYDEALIGRLVATIERFEAQWSAWFASQGLVPHEVTYEELAADPIATARAVLDALGLDIPTDRALEVRARRQADDVNAEWVARFAARRR